MSPFQPEVEVLEPRGINWWLIAGGIVLIIFAIGTFAAPVFFLELVTIMAGFGFVFSGVTNIVTYFRLRPIPGAAGTLLMAVLDIAVGVLMLVYPLVFAPVLPWMLGACFVAFGLLEIVGSAPLGQVVPESRVIMVISGILTVVVGAMFFMWPESLSIWVAAFALIRGVTLIVCAIANR